MLNGKRTRRNPWEDIAQNTAIVTALKLLPSNYEFEVPKTIWKVLSLQAEVVALQFPEGLLMYSCLISDMIRRFTGSRTIILSDVTYGACCIDDYTAKKLGADCLIHYGHSCLVPISSTCVKTLYVFVEIHFSTEHLIKALQENFPKSARLSVLGTVQFIKAVQEVKAECSSFFERIDVPQVKPLSQGETLGCTSPSLSSDSDYMIFIADGRFHMESAMIRNPQLKAFRYDPYSKRLTIEKYDNEKMMRIRLEMIQKAKASKLFGIVLGTLGHQGNSGILQRLKSLLNKKKRATVTFLMSELLPTKLKLIPRIEVWIQIACPRLSIDWGLEYDRIILTPYEAMVALEEVDWQGVYPMDYYSNEKSPWSNYY